MRVWCTHFSSSVTALQCINEGFFHFFFGFWIVLPVLIILLSIGSLLFLSSNQSSGFSIFPFNYPTPNYRYKVIESWKGKKFNLVVTLLLVILWLVERSKRNGETKARVRIIRNNPRSASLSLSFFHYILMYLRDIMKAIINLPSVLTYCHESWLLIFVYYYSVLP